MAWLGLLTLALAGASPAAQATLGGDTASVDADQAAFHAQASVVTATGYTDHVLRLPDGLVVHELVNAGGHVFQVTWSGRGHRPDMVRLLGAYAPRMATPDRPTGPMSRHADVVRPEIEIHSAVHARFFSGSAHVPGLSPSELSGPVAVGSSQR